MLKNYLLLTAAVILFAAGCGNDGTATLQNSEKSNAAPNVSQSTKSDELKVAEVISAFRAAKMPLNQLEFFNAASDPDKKLGQPNQYSGKAVWQTTEKMHHFVEQFDDEADLQAARAELEKTNKTGTSNADFIYAHKNILVRIDHAMVPETAAKFEQILKTL